jgi:hypothetical protein
MITFRCPSLMKCWNGLQTIPSFVSLMGNMVIIKSPSILMIKARPLSHALMEPTPIVGCRSGCVMHLLRFKGA